MNYFGGPLQEPICPDELLKSLNIKIPAELPKYTDDCLADEIGRVLISAFEQGSFNFINLGAGCTSIRPVLPKSIQKWFSVILLRIQDRVDKVDFDFSKEQWMMYVSNDGLRQVLCIKR